jgi:hypothetical protein
MSLNSSPTPSNHESPRPAAAAQLEAAHNAAWDRFNAAEAAYMANPASLPAMREYNEACKQLQHVRNQYFVNSLRGM